MIEIRRIRPDEGDAFLALVCDVFDLDFERARTVFYHEPYLDFNRKWVLFDNGVMVSCVTTTPLLFGWGQAIGIAGVATRSGARGLGNAARLLNTVIADATRQGEGPALLFAKDARLYDSLGFETVDVVVRASLQTSDITEDAVPMPNDEVQRLYREWSERDSHRLRRDAHRWRNWNWHYRVCEGLADGYMASEPGVLREAVFSEALQTLPLLSGTEWVGLSRVAELLGLPTSDAKQEMFVMARGFPAPPVMFLTDQF